MSKSREKRARKALAAEGLTEKQIQQQMEEQKERQKSLIYKIVGAVAAICVAGILVWNSGIVQANATAATIDGTNYNAGYMQYYYTTVAQNEMYNTYYGMSTYDYYTAASEQIQDATTGATYEDYFRDQALEEAKSVLALYKAAQAEGFTLSDEAEQTRTETIESLTTQAYSNGYSDAETYLKAMYGTYMTMDTFEQILDEQLIASYYAESKMESFTFTDEELDSYYQENKDSLDSYEYTYATLTAAAPDAEVDADGNTIERTDEETAALLEASQVETMAAAEQISAALAAGEDVDALGLDVTYSLYEDNVKVGSSVNTSFFDWISDSSRQAGDVTIAEYDGGTYTVYYVVYYQSRTLLEDATASVRHILVAAEQDESATEPTDEQYATAKTQAEEILAGWQSGEATEDAFAELATQYSADTSSATNGGLLSGINAASTYVDTFQDWALDSSRKTGDVEIVQNTGSTTKGWHIMYFQEWGDPVWKITADSALLSATYTQWSEELSASVTATVGSGMSYVGG